MLVSTANSCAFMFENDDWSSATKLIALFDMMSKMPVAPQPETAKFRAVIADFVCSVSVAPSSSPQPVSAAASIPSTTPLDERYLFMTVLLGLHDERRPAR